MSWNCQGISHCLEWSLWTCTPTKKGMMGTCTLCTRGGAVHDCQNRQLSMTSVLPVTRAVVKHYWYNVFFVAFETQEAFEGDKTGRSWPMLHSSTLWWCDSCKCFMTCNFGSYVSAVIVLRLLSNCDEMLESVVQGSHTSRLSIWKSQKFFPQISRPWNIPWKFCLLNYTVVVSSRL